MARGHGAWIWSALAIAVAIAAAARRAEAQSPTVEAEAMFRQGKDLMASGKIADACAAFDLSQKLDPRATTLINQANCRERNGQFATAWGLFLEAARQTRQAADAASQQLHTVAADRAAKLETRLSTLQIDVPPDSQVTGLEIRRNGELFDPIAWNKPLPIDGGAYRISARAPGAAEWTSEVSVAPANDTKRLAIPKLVAVKIAPPDVSAAATGAARRTGAQREVGSEGGDVAGTTWTARRKIAIGVAAGGAIALAVGGVLGSSAKTRQSDAHELCPAPASCDDADRANDLIHSGHSLAIGADVAFGVGAVALVTAGVLWFTGSPERAAGTGIAIAPSAAPGLVGLTASGRF